LYDVASFGDGSDPIRVRDYERGEIRSVSLLDGIAVVSP
jgi:hypothetical protein